MLKYFSNTIVEELYFVFCIAELISDFISLISLLELVVIISKIFLLITADETKLNVFKKVSLKSTIVKSLSNTIYESDMRFTIFCIAIGLIFKKPNLKIENAKHNIVIEKHIGVMYIDKLNTHNNPKILTIIGINAPKNINND